ncbi:plasmid mobilization protein [Paracoccus benzoatiresistens]|uniref:Mobilization protein n=1 Tax=Paracoccus benzoatiresistens TaxID=2997341 RepID=A0ABT4J5J1_9RHOB|nr:hypothetical protein [Paracoccus sp. EF6]MCZ0962392.1 hypothetical protein [Paracoccus sp. EF6]
MARPRKCAEEKRKKWDVLNVTSAERAEITAEAREAGLGISAYLLTCRRQTRLVRRGDREGAVRLLARIDSHLAEIAGRVMAAPFSGLQAAELLLILRRIEDVLSADALGADKDGPEGGGKAMESTV